MLNGARINPIRTPERGCPCDCHLGAMVNAAQAPHDARATQGPP